MIGLRLSQREAPKGTQTEPEDPFPVPESVSA